MRALIACERSGILRRALRARGIDAYSCDLSPADDDEQQYHLRVDALIVAHGEPWDLLIAHPPCTYLCNSGVSRFHHTPPNPSPGVLYGEARRAALQRAAQFVAALWNAPIARVAIENPIMHGEARRAINTASMIGCGPGSLRWSHWHPFGAPAQTIQPYQFGDDASKRTALWLRGLPRLRPWPQDRWASPRYVCQSCGFTWRAGWAGEDCRCGSLRIRPRWSNQTDSGQNKLAPSADRAQRRAETYPGIAEAIADQYTTGGA